MKLRAMDEKGERTRKATMKTVKDGWTRVLALFVLVISSSDNCSIQVQASIEEHV